MQAAFNGCCATVVKLRKQSVLQFTVAWCGVRHSTAVGGKGRAHRLCSCVGMLVPFIAVLMQQLQFCQVN